MAKPVPLVRGRSTAEIEAIATRILQRHSPDTLVGKASFPVLKYIDGPLFDEYGVEFDVQDLGSSIEGKLEGHTLILNTHVYEGLLQNRNRPRFTGAHEAGHAVLHAGQLAVMNDSARGQPTLYRKDEIKPYLNPEWQANVFASAILMPLPGIEAILRRMTSRSLMLATPMVSSQFCVPEQAAELRLKKLMGKGQILM